MIFENYYIIFTNELDSKIRGGNDDNKTKL